MDQVTTGKDETTSKAAEMNDIASSSNGSHGGTNEQHPPLASTTMATTKHDHNPLPLPEQKEKQQEEENNIGKAIRFWTHPSLREISPEQKRAYLSERGVTDIQIKKAWERIAEGETAPKTTTTATSTNIGSNLPGSTTTSPTNHHNPKNNPGPPYFGQQQQQRGPYDYPQQQQQPIPQYGGVYPPPPYPEEEDDGPVSLSQGISLVALGSVLGLAAAATVRWLNGGDFSFLPPPTFSSSKTATTRSALSGPQISCETKDDDDNNNNNISNGDDEEVVFYNDDQEEDEDEEEHDGGDWLEHQLLEKMDALSSTIQSSTTLQEKILQKLSIQTSITDHSMDLLRSADKKKISSSSASSSTESNNDILETKDQQQLQTFLSQLVDLKTELSSLRHRRRAEEEKKDGNGTIDDTSGASIPGTSDSWEQHLETTLANLDKCMSQVQNFLGTVKSKSWNNAAPSGAGAATAETTGTATSEASTTGTPHRRPPPSATGASTVSSTITTPLSSSSSRSTTSPSDGHPQGVLSLRNIVRKIAEEPNATTRRTGCQLLYLYVVNLSGRPDNPRYRKIYTSNESFQQVENLKGAKELLFALGFVEDPKNPCLEWKPNHYKKNNPENIDDNDDEATTTTTNDSPPDELVMQRLQEAAAALSILKSSRPSDSLVESALAVLSTEEPATALSPPLPESPVHNNSIASPPIPKKHPYVPPSDTPVFITKQEPSPPEIEQDLTPTPETVSEAT